MGLVLKMPDGWRALEEHLIRFHAVPRVEVEAMDSDWLRSAHLYAHDVGQFNGDVHAHG